MAESEQAFWDGHARHDPLWAILSDPARAGRRWDLRGFLETGRREISLLMYQLRALGIQVDRRAALDFGCGVGRLSQPLAGWFDRVVGVDISPEMIRLARAINPHPDRVEYIHNPAADLAALRTGEFTFMYSNVVLQHIEPAIALGYLRELLRVVGPGGVLVFQLPSHPRPPEEQQAPPVPMQEDAYRAAVRVEGCPASAAPGADIVLHATVVNTSARTWSQREAGALRLGNHWRAAADQAMLIQDDGRATLPEALAPGQGCQLILQVTAPPDAGMYLLECDLVHEGVSWFADRGSHAWRQPVQVGAASPAHEAPGGAASAAPTAAELPGLARLDSADPPGPLPMHGIPRDLVERVVREHGGSLLHVEADERCGREWVGYRYFVRRG
jgi:SAM-dependent methyltransferase